MTKRRQTKTKVKKTAIINDVEMVKGEPYFSYDKEKDTIILELLDYCGDYMSMDFSYKYMIDLMDKVKEIRIKEGVKD